MSSIFQRATPHLKIANQTEADYKATMQLFVDLCEEGKIEQAEELRLRLQTVLDVFLDAIIAASREIKRGGA